MPVKTSIQYSTLDSGFRRNDDLFMPITYGTAH